MDVEAHLLPHFTDRDSMRTLLDSGVKGQHFADRAIGEAYDRALAYFVSSHMQRALTRELIEEEWPGLVERRGWHDDYTVALLIDKLKEKYRRGRLQDVLRDVGSRVMDDPEEALNLAVQETTALMMDTADRDRASVYASNFDARWASYLDRAMMPEGDRYGIPFGWPEVTEEMFGIHPRELAIVAATPGQGKSWAACKVALEAASAGKRVYFASLENDKEMTMRRLDCIVSRVPYTDYERGRLNAFQMQAVKEAREKIVALGDNLVVDRPTKAEDRTVFQLYARAAQHGTDLFVGDQISWVTSTGKQQERWQEVANIITDIAGLTTEFGMASVWISQFNREAARAKGKGRLHHLANSDAGGQYADWVFALYRNDSMEAEDVMILEMLKARRSAPKAWQLYWRLSDQTLMDVRAEYRPS